MYRLRAGEAVLIREVSLSLRNVLTEWFQYSYGEMYHDPATHMYARTHVHTHACKHVCMCAHMHTKMKKKNNNIQLSHLLSQRSPTVHDLLPVLTPSAISASTILCRVWY